MFLMCCFAFFFFFFQAEDGIRDLIVTGVQTCALPIWLIFAAMMPALFYFFFAVFPVSSPLDRRVPWLKWLLLVAGAAVAFPLAVGALSGGQGTPVGIVRGRFHDRVPRSLGPVSNLGALRP